MTSFVCFVCVLRLTEWVSAASPDIWSYTHRSCKSWWGFSLIVSAKLTPVFQWLMNYSNQNTSVIIFIYTNDICQPYLCGDESECCFTETLAIVVFCSCSSYNKLNMQQELKQKRAVLATCCRLLIQSVSHLHVCSFCVVLLFVQEDCRVSGWPSPLWGFTMAAGSLCTFQILIPLHWSTWRRLASIKTAHRTKRPYGK